MAKTKSLISNCISVSVSTGDGTRGLPPELDGALIPVLNVSCRTGSPQKISSGLTSTKKTDTHLTWGLQRGHFKQITNLTSPSDIHGAFHLPRRDPILQEKTEEKVIFIHHFTTFGWSVVWLILKARKPWSRMLTVWNWNKGGKVIVSNLSFKTGVLSIFWWKTGLENTLLIR